MFRRACLRIAPSGPAWTAFKSLVDQSLIPNVTSTNAAAVFEGLSQDQLQQLAKADVAAPATSTATGRRGRPAGSKNATTTAVSKTGKRGRPAGSKNKPGKRGRPSTKPGKRGRPSTKPGKRGRPSTKPGKRGRKAITLRAPKGGKLSTDLAKMVAVESAFYKANTDANDAKFFSLTQKQRDELLKGSVSKLSPERKKNILETMDHAVPTLAKRLYQLYRYNGRGGNTAWEALSKNQHKALQGVAQLYKAKNGKNVSLDTVDYALKNADSVMHRQTEGVAELIRRGVSSQ